MKRKGDTSGYQNISKFFKAAPSGSPGSSPSIGRSSLSQPDSRQLTPKLGRSEGISLSQSPSLLVLQSSHHSPKKSPQYRVKPYSPGRRRGDLLFVERDVKDGEQASTRIVEAKSADQPVASQRQASSTRDVGGAHVTAGPSGHDQSKPKPRDLPESGSKPLEPAHRQLFVRSRIPDPSAEQDALLDLLGGDTISDTADGDEHSKPGTSEGTLSDAGDPRSDIAAEVADITGDVGEIVSRVGEMGAEIGSVGKKSPRSSQPDRQSEKGLSQSSDHKIKGSFDDSMFFDNPIDLSVSDDDDDLPGADKILTRAHSSRLLTPSKTPFRIPKKEAVLDALEDLSPSTTDVSKATANLDRLKMNLDSLLAERMREEENNREMVAMEEELQNGLKSGGISKFVPSDTEDDLMPEHQRQLRELVICEKVIVDHPPGERVFQLEQCQYLFNHSSLTPKDMGFTPGDSCIDACLTKSPQEIMEVLMDGVAQMCFDSISCPDICLSWVFHIMSVHPNILAVQGCYQLLYYILNRNEGPGSTWAPTPTDLARVLVNYGAKLSELCIRNDFIQIDMEDLVFDQEKENIEVPRPGNVNRSCGFLENLKFVFHTFTNAIIHRTDQYSSDEVMAISLMVFRAALDKELNDDCLKHDLQVFFAAAFNAFSDAEWPHKMVQFCEILPTFSDHHHNCVHLVHILPPVERGHSLQRRLAYAMLQKFLLPEQEREAVKGMTVQLLFRIIQRIEVKNNENFYQLSSIIRLIDLCVGNENLKVTEKEDLKRLSDMVRSLMGDVRELINVLDRTLVKDIMVRLTSKWSFMMQNMGTKQRTMFDYTQHHEGDSQNIEEISQSQETESEQEQSDLDLGLETDVEDNVPAETRHPPENTDAEHNALPLSQQSNELDSSQLPDIEPVLNLLEEDDPNEIRQLVESQTLDKMSGADSDSEELPEL